METDSDSVALGGGLPVEQMGSAPRGTYEISRHDTHGTALGYTVVDVVAGITEAQAAAECAIHRAMCWTPGRRYTFLRVA